MEEESLAIKKMGKDLLKPEQPGYLIPEVEEKEEE